MWRSVSKSKFLAAGDHFCPARLLLESPGLLLAQQPVSSCCPRGSKHWTPDPPKGAAILSLVNESSATSSVQVQNQVCHGLRQRKRHALHAMRFSRQGLAARSRPRISFDTAYLQIYQNTLYCLRKRQGQKQSVAPYSFSSQIDIRPFKQEQQRQRPPPR